MKTTTLLCITAIALASCRKQEGPTPGTPTAAPSPELKTVIDASTEGEVQAIHIVRESTKPGDTITVSGRVMGSSSPFVAGRAVFILGDPEVLTPCNDKPDDPCETPWDTCCDTMEDKKRGTATVQILGEDGGVLKEDIEGVGGIEKLAKLIVSGTVADGSSSDLLLINATAIDIME